MRYKWEKAKYNLQKYFITHRGAEIALAIVIFSIIGYCIDYTIGWVK